VNASCKTIGTRIAIDMLFRSLGPRSCQIHLRAAPETSSMDSEGLHCHLGWGSDTSSARLQTSQSPICLTSHLIVANIRWFPPEGLVDDLEVKKRIEPTLFRS
jgi:hypothetical protein